MLEDSFLSVVSIFLFMLIVLALFAGTGEHSAAYYTVAPL
jgi:hypothetical protein